MKMLSFLSLWWSVSVFASVENLPNVCYDMLDAGQFCTADAVGKVQVFIYNAGWCPPCNDEMAELSREYSEFAGKPVVFASLSGEGYSHGSKPDQSFLKSWKAKHKIPFVVAGKQGDFGKNFGANGYIPYSVIVDKAGNIADKGNLEASDIMNKVRELVGAE